MLAERGLPEHAPVEALRAITGIAAALCGVPSAVVDLLDGCFQLRARGRPRVGVLPRVHTDDVEGLLDAVRSVAATGAAGSRRPSARRCAPPPSSAGCCSRRPRSAWPRPTPPAALTAGAADDDRSARRAAGMEQVLVEPGTRAQLRAVLAGEPAPAGGRTTR